MSDLKTRVINVRDLHALQEAKASGDYVPVHRPSHWGNPFIIGRHGSRDEVLEQYLDWIGTHSDLKAEIPTLQGKILGCFCVQKDDGSKVVCHAEILAALADGNGVAYHPDGGVLIRERITIPLSPEEEKEMVADLKEHHAENHPGG